MIGVPAAPVVVLAAHPITDVDFLIAYDKLAAVVRVRYAHESFGFGEAAVVELAGKQQQRLLTTLKPQIPGNATVRPTRASGQDTRAWCGFRQGGVDNDHIQTVRGEPAAFNRKHVFGGGDLPCLTIKIDGPQLSDRCTRLTPERKNRVPDPKGKRAA
jgi:hypothetical protein